MMHIKSYAKINLSLDVGSPMSNGMHPVDMIMQQTTLHDDVIVEVCEACAFCNALELADGFSLLLKTDSPDVPVDESNIAFRAAALMVEKYMELKPETSAADNKKTICVFIEKHIPIAAGLAGGSGNAAAVIHALNAIWSLGLSLSELCDIGKRIGSDVPFCIIGQAKETSFLEREIQVDPQAASCARARGTGTDLKPVAPLKAHLVIAKPKIGVSTAEVYRGIDSCEIEERPDNDRLEDALNSRSMERAIPEMINVLENYTLNTYPEVMELKKLMKEKMTSALHVLMSGSGPSVFAIFDDEQAAIEGFKTIRSLGYEAHLCKAK